MELTDDGIRTPAVVIISVVLLGGSACALDAGEQRSEAEADAAEQMSADFYEQGKDDLAERIEDTELTELTRVETPYLQDWEVFEVSTDDPDWDHGRLDAAVATSEHGSEVLTDNPQGFRSVLSGDSGRIEDAETAIRAVEDHITLTATRVDDAFTTVLEGMDDVDSLSIYEEEFAEIAEEFDDEINPPTAEQVDDGFRVTAYVQHNFEIHTWTVTVKPDGSLESENEIFVEDVHGQAGETP